MDFIIISGALTRRDHLENSMSKLALNCRNHKSYNSVLLCIFYQNVIDIGKNDKNRGEDGNAWKKLQGFRCDGASDQC